VADAAWPSQAFVVNAPSVPLALAAGVHTKLSPGPRSVVPGVTGAPPLVNVPLLANSTRKLTVSPSTSSSLAAAANAV